MYVVNLVYIVYTYVESKNPIVSNETLSQFMSP